MQVKGFLLEDKADQEFLLAIQLASHGMFERSVLREKIDGAWIELNANAEETWRPRTEAISAVLGYLQRLWQQSTAAREHDN